MCVAPARPDPLHRSPSLSFLSSPTSVDTIHGIEFADNPNRGRNRREIDDAESAVRNARKSRSHGADKRASKRPPGAGLVSCLMYDAHSYFSRHFLCLYETTFAQCCDGVYCNGLAYHLPSFFFSRPGPTRAINKQQATTATNRRLSLAYRCVSIFLGPWYGGR